MTINRRVNAAVFAMGAMLGAGDLRAGTEFAPSIEHFIGPGEEVSITSQYANGKVRRTYTCAREGEVEATSPREFSRAWAYVHLLPPDTVVRVDAYSYRNSYVVPRWPGHGGGQSTTIVTTHVVRCEKAERPLTDGASRPAGGMREVAPAGQEYQCALSRIPADGQPETVCGRTVLQSFSPSLAPSRRSAYFHECGQVSIAWFFGIQLSKLEPGTPESWEDRRPVAYASSHIETGMPGPERLSLSIAASG